MDTHNWRLLHTFTLRSPLSHIGETISTTAYLLQEPILQPDGRVEEVFCYSGNAWRGQLRDLMASYLLDALGNPTIALDAFHLLYAGGAIGGAQQTNLATARAYRQTLTPIALLGGGVGNQVLPGKARVSNFYPRCLEAPPSAMPAGDDPRALVSYRALTFEKSFSRKDDSKDPRHAATLAPPAAEQGALALNGDTAPKRAREDAPQQMRMTVELLIAGAVLTGHIDLLDASEVELGCLVAALHAFARSPHIGGQAQRGHGLVTLETTLLDLDTSETYAPFVTIGDRAQVAPRADDAKQAYDAHLRDLYDGLLAASGDDIRRMIGAGT